MRAGLRTQNQLALSSSLQVLFNLHILWPGVRSVLDELSDAVDSTFSMRAVTSAMTSAIGQTVIQQAERFMTALVSQTIHILFLQQILDKKTDALTHTKFSQEIEEHEPDGVLSYFWTSCRNVANLKILIN